ncbi:PorP/SprF family type IX secretion system membrane protein [Porifericola rhodea]|uniref:PorP/SprF family type IX secretion system membrane protein n=1 Tax=Porifericola rhodea TaxID=930972 RepID=UPI002666FADD|nr:PorP/SprF family type IX secretion system membrane protein [Porifericola rhodea]WKN32039.1 PorP/SprF family type IX secretion system membrane protein [Porifericola rhodea]
MRKTAIILFLLIFSICSAEAQRMPFFTHYYNNPYLYNPAYAGYDKHSVFYLTHRQQWFGVEGAPMSTQLSFHTPMGNANPLFFGADVVDDRLGALKHNAVKASLAYMLPLSSEYEHYIKTAFSFGLGMHSYDLSSMDIGDDQVLQAALSNRSYLDGRFGFRYHNRGFNLSVALPHLFTPPPVLVEGFGDIAFDQFSRMIFSTHYRFNFNEEGSVAFEPTVLYHYSQVEQSQLEALGILYFKESFWAGGGYQQQSGISGTAGFRVKNLKFSYAYSTGGSEVSAYGMGTHEAQLGIIIGKKKEVLKRKPRLSTQNTIDDIPDEALLEKHEKSRKKSERKKKREKSVPDRKKVNPAPSVILVEPTENKGTTEQEQPNNDSSQSQNTSEMVLTNAPSTKSSTEDTQATKNAIPVTKQQQTSRDYSDLNFDSFENESGVIQLGEDGDASPSSASQQQQAKQLNEQQPKRTEDIPQNKSSETKEISWDSPANNKTSAEEKEAHPLALKGGFYIIAGTFSTEANAQKLVDQLSQQGFFPEIGYHTEKQYFYVHVFQGGTKDKALQELDRLKQNATFQKSWILTVE